MNDAPPQNFPDQTPCPTDKLAAWKHMDPQHEWGHCGARPYPCPCAVGIECCSHTSGEHMNGRCAMCDDRHQLVHAGICGETFCQRHKDEIGRLPDAPHLQRTQVM